MHRHNAFNLTTFVMVFGLVVFISAGHHYARGQEPALNAVLRLPEGVKMEALSDPKEAAKVADRMEKLYPVPRSEAAQMLIAILRGSQLEGTDGWFGPASSKYGYAWLAKLCGVDPKDKGIPKGKFTGAKGLFDRLDRDGDGAITERDLDWSDRNPMVMQANFLNRIFRRVDGSGDGHLTREELDAMFDRLSRGRDHFTADDFRQAFLPRGSGGFSPGDAPTIPTLVKGLFAGEIGSMGEGPAVGDKAPDFSLEVAEGQERVQLFSLIGKKPVVLCFGNFTCGPFRALYPDVEAVFERYKDKANFVMVYVREAHPADGWKMEMNSRMGVEVTQPKNREERKAVCGQFRDMMKPGMTVLVDDIHDPAGTAYSGMPARLYVINTQGKVVFKNGRGPFGFKPGEMEQALVMSLLDGEKPAKQGVSIPVQTDEECWNRLPRLETGTKGALPNWAKAVAEQLPRTAAAMLELDLAHRTKSPLDPALRAKMRWMVAKANRCDYAQKTALADLEKVAGPASVAILTGNPAQWPQSDKAPLEFARLLTLDAPNITDSFFGSLRKENGEQKMAAMVLLAAYGNFQDRLLLGLNIQLEKDGPLSPLQVRFDPAAFQVAPILPGQKKVPGLLAPGKSVVPTESAWGKLGYEELQARLEKQRERQPRLPIPTWEEVRKNLPLANQSKPTRIVWSLVCNGYAPELAVPWNITTRTMWAESPQDRVFEESLFWIQTKTMQCNYCMGHCEMLLEVAGLDKAGVEERTRKLAGNDWSVFPPEEQVAFAFARKLSGMPWDLTGEDYRKLEESLGKGRAMATFWWLCRGLYMTRVSDGFQLPLERENVFGDMGAKK